MKFKERLMDLLMSGNCISRIFKKIVKVIDLYIQKLSVKIFSRKIPIQNNKIFFMNFQGTYTCNPAAIANEIIRQKLPYELVFATRKEHFKKENIIKEFPEQVKLVKRGSYDFFVETASSKILIDNSINFEYLSVPKKKGQYLFETWHGSLGLKKMTPDAVSSKLWVHKAKKEGKKTDFCISNSKFETELVYKNNYWHDCKIYEYGHPRNDILFDTKNAKKIDKKVREYFEIPKDKKIVLYAPTFRDDKTLDHYNLNLIKLKKTLNEYWGGDWVILLRLHFQLRKLVSQLKTIDGVIDATEYVDIQELISVCDLGITDYSSWICDLALTKKPGFLYTPDLDDYNSERGFFYPLTETPFPIARTNGELMKKIKDFDIKEYEQKRLLFLEKRGCVEDGNASKRVVEKIKEIIEKGENQ